jgi:hypothetical protein
MTKRSQNQNDSIDLTDKIEESDSVHLNYVRGVNDVVDWFIIPLPVGKDGDGLGVLVEDLQTTNNQVLTSIVKTSGQNTEYIERDRNYDSTDLDLEETINKYDTEIESHLHL